jgi:hypothetical protein
VHERSYYLAQCVLCGRSAPRLEAQDVEAVNQAEEWFDVSCVQLEVIRGIENHPLLSPQEKSEVLAQLDSRLLLLDEVGNHADPFRASGLMV